LAEHSNSQARVVGIASLIWAGSIFLSRVIGLVREQIIGRTLGASRAADVYFASFTLPDFLNYLLAAGDPNQQASKMRGSHTGTAIATS
jgi:putative peptidoglycan lipid II flippase